MNPLRIVFMGTPEFAIPSLSAIIDSGHNILAVYTQPARKSGRGKRLQITKVAEFAQLHGLEIRSPDTLNNSKSINQLKATAPDITVVVAYGQILPPEILAIPTFGCINAHASLLPRWRGAAPIQRAIMEGDETTGVTIMQMESGLDTGPILAKKTIPISDETTGGKLHDTLATLSAQMLTKILECPKESSLAAITQEPNGITYAKKIERSDTRIDWRNPAHSICLQIRGLSPNPGAWFDYKGERIKVLKAKIQEQKSLLKIGSIYCNKNSELVVTCGSKTTLSLQQLQQPGKKPLYTENFLRGKKFEPETVLQCPDIN